MTTTKLADCGYMVKNGCFGAGLSSGEILVIKLPDSKVMQIVSRSVFLALVIITLPYILKGSSVHSQLNNGISEQDNNFDFEQLRLLFNDLAREGLRREADKSLFVSSSNVGMIHGVRSLIDNEDGFDVVVDSDYEGKNAIEDESLDFVFGFDLLDATFLDRILKIGGIVAVPLSNDPFGGISTKPNYKIVYLRRYTTTFVAMRKTSAIDVLPVNPDHRRLLQSRSKAKEGVVKSVEDVMFEPPKQSYARSRKYLRKMKFHPNLLGGSLQNYERRVFVNAELEEENSGAIKWFHKNYPKMNTKFEVHNLEVETSEEDNSSNPPQNNVLHWLEENVKDEDYVVMKAEAEVVVEIMKSKAIVLVDELFLECNNEWWQKAKSDKSKRAYWQCISLYGRLKDLGVVVHQWFL